jgi:hypothetical protein
MGVYFESRGTETPNFCPNCGEKMHFDDDRLRFDFFNKNSFSCACGTAIIYTDRRDLSDQIQDELDHYHPIL